VEEERHDGKQEIRLKEERDEHHHNISDSVVDVEEKVDEPDVEEQHGCRRTGSTSTAAANANFSMPSAKYARMRARLGGE